MREIAFVLEGCAEARARDLDLAYYTAWHAGYFSQPFKNGRMPEYDKHAPRRRLRPAMTGRQMLETAMRMTAALGGQIIRKED